MIIDLFVVELGPYLFLAFTGYLNISADAMNVLLTQGRQMTTLDNHRSFGFTFYILCVVRIGSLPAYQGLVVILGRHHHGHSAAIL